MSRLQQMLIREQSKRERSQRDLAREYGWSQQAFATWIAGAVPRQQFHASVARFLSISPDDVAMLADEARVGGAKATNTGNTKLPDMGAPVMGRGTLDSIALDKFASGYAKPSVAGTYAVRIDGQHVWVNPRLTPVAGNTVLLRSGSEGKLATWPVEHDGDVHVVVLREMV